MSGIREKIVFANQLRGLAACSVMLSHLGGVIILMGPTVSWVISAPRLNLGSPFILHLTRFAWLNLGAFGVAVFFLISGFVIPFSLERYTWRGFLTARIFRIFPTYWVALLIEAVAVAAQSRFYGRPMAFGPLTYFYNATLLDTVFGKGYVDLVNWTLAIEVKFYILIAALWPLVRRGRVLPFVAWSLFAIALAAMQRHGILPVADQFADEPMYIAFMLIGTVFYFRMSSRISRIRAVFTVLTLSVLLAACWRAGPIQNQFPVVTVNYLYALLVFAAAYIFRAYFRPVKIVDFLADISFPFYLIHSVIGYSLITFMVSQLGLSYAVALPIAVVTVICLAWLIHVGVEQPTQRIGKGFANLAALKSRHSMTVIPKDTHPTPADPPSLDAQPLA